jgi:aminopeptidase N
MKKIIILLVLAAGVQIACAQVRTRSYIVDPAGAPRERNVDFIHMRAELSFEPEKGLVKGKVTHIFTPLRPKVDSIFLDAPGITIKEVTANGKKADFKTNAAGVTVYFPGPFSWGTRDSITVIYEAVPRKGLYFIGWNDPNGISRKQVWSQGQGIDNRYWLPMYDEMNDKMTTEMIVKFNKDYKVLSNGTKLKEKDNKDGTITWHYKMKNPHAPYLVMLGIGKYEIKESRSKSGVLMRMYYYPEMKDRVETTYRYSEEMMDWFEKEIGVPYGWESYSQIPVQDFMYGAMENTTATVFGDFFLVDERSYLDRNYVGVNAHELAHQWFGDLITARSSAHHWLQESFATYYNQMYEREVFGQDYFDWARRQANWQALDESKKNKLGVGHSEGGSVRHYPKGAYVLNMLKYVVGGKEPYNKSIKYYLEKHKYQNVDSEDLLVAFHETLGYSLDWFWEEWIYRGGEPAYKVNHSIAPGGVTFHVEQVHEKSPLVGLPEAGPLGDVSHDPFVPQVESSYREEGLYKMPVWFEVHYMDGSSERRQVWIEAQHHEVFIPVTRGKQVDYVLFDPNSEVLKSVSFDKPFEMLGSQAMKAKHMLDRYDALVAMRSYPLAQKRDVLLGVYAKETFHATKGEIIYQLMNDTDAKSKDLIKSAINDKDAQVRKAVLAYTKTIPADLAPEYEKLLKDPSYEVIANALEKLSRDHPAHVARYLEATKGVEGTTGRIVLVKWLEIAAERTGEKKHTDQLVAFTGNSYEFRTRVNAMNALKKLGYFDRKLLENLLEAAYSANNRLAGPAGDVLKYYYEQSSHKKTIDDHLASRKWEDWQKQAIGRYLPL